MLQAVIYYIVTMILTKELVTAQCTIYHFESPGESCEDIYNKNPQSHDTSGYYWILDGPRIVYCGMSYTGSSCEDIYNSNPETVIKSGYYRINYSQWTYCKVDVYNYTGSSCEDIYSTNPASRDKSGYYHINEHQWIYCIMTTADVYNYTGSSCEDIYVNNPETADRSGYYPINESQWTYCNMTAIANGDFITTCAGVGGGWRRIVNINISAGDDCPGQWRKATHSNVSFCRVANDYSWTRSSATFSTNGISYQRVCGRARGYQKGDTRAFRGSPSYSVIDVGYVAGLSITYSSNPRQHIWTFASGRGERFNNRFNCPCSIVGANDPPSYVGSNYYCESGSTYQGDYDTYYFNDTLWDGVGCVDNCCNNTTQPWFYRQLNQITQDGIEARICTLNSFKYESTLIDQLELYIQ